MKKALIVVVALLLAIPAVSYAGSATSRWDMTIGGYVKADVVYADQYKGPDAGGPAQRDVSTDPRNKYGALTWAGGQTTLNFAIKGPDAMGAKTSAFVEGWFHGRNITVAGQGIGTANAAGDYGLFSLTHAYMQLIWPKTTLTIGQTWMGWGFLPALNLFSPGDAHLNKGFTRVPQIRLTQALTKNFTAQFGVQAPYDTSVTNNSTPVFNANPAANGYWPDVFADVSYASDACGKIGPMNLKIGVGGFYGKNKYVFTNGVTTALDDQKVDRWGATFYAYVPIIPEKKLGNKAGALAFAGTYTKGQGMSGQYSPWIITPNAQWQDSGLGGYIRGSGALVSPTGAATVPTVATGAEIKYPMVDMWWVQGTFYLTNQWWFNAFYGSIQQNWSSTFINNPANAGNYVRNQEFAAAILYDVNPAMRFGIQYSRDTTAYAVRSTATASSQGSYNSVRFGAWYFF